MNAPATGAPLPRPPPGALGADCVGRLNFLIRSVLRIGRAKPADKAPGRGPRQWGAAEGLAEALSVCSATVYAVCNGELERACVGASIRVLKGAPMMPPAAEINGDLAEEGLWNAGDVARYLKAITTATAITTTIATTTAITARSRPSETP